MCFAMHQMCCCRHHRYPFVSFESDTPGGFDLGWELAKPRLTPHVFWNQYGSEMKCSTNKSCFVLLSSLFEIIPIGAKLYGDQCLLLRLLPDYNILHCTFRVDV